jgi:hypothetical protein
MLDDQGVPHLMDFGLAARLDESEKLTHDGAIMGTRLYVAPEQAAVKTIEVGPAGDQYSLGVVLYEMLYGQPPFSSSRQAVVLHHLEMEPPALRKHVPHLPPRDLETICLETLANKPGSRYTSCQEFAEDLQRWLDDRPIKARRATLPERLVKWSRRQPALAVLTVTTFLVAILGFTGVTLALRQARERAEAEGKAHGVAKQERQRADAERYRAEVRMVRSFLERGVNLRQLGDVGRRLVLLAHALKLTEEVKELPSGAQDEKETQAHQDYLRHLDWLIRTNLAGWHPRLAIRLRTRLPHKDWIWDVAFSVDGKPAATACKDGFAGLWNTETGERVAELPMSFPV